MGRRLVYWALVRHGEAVDSYLEGSRLILPRFMVKPLAPVVIRILARDHQARDAAVRQDLAALPGEELGGLRVLPERVVAGNGPLSTRQSLA